MTSPPGAPPHPAATVVACPDGPLLVRGDVRIVGPDGTEIPRHRRTVALCRCGRSGLAPWCDGTHKLVRFRDADATWFFDEHVEADAVHEQIAGRDLAGGLVEAEPDQLEELLLGAATVLALDARAGARLLAAWAEGRSSLRSHGPWAETA